MQKKYKVLVADCPWSYSDHNTGGNYKSGSVTHDTTMKPSTVAKMRVPEIAHEDSALFLWATTPSPSRDTPGNGGVGIHHIRQ